MARLCVLKQVHHGWINDIDLASKAMGHINVVHVVRPH
jgi:hypothetical protein